MSGLLPADRVVTRGAYSLAFAGAGNVSLKEALDAAHGHEHNPDGSETTPEQAAAKSHDAHDHEESAPGALTMFSLAANALLLVLLVLVTWRSRKSAVEDGITPAISSSERPPQAG